MITVRLQIILGLLIITAFIIIVIMVRRRNLELKYALSWFVLLIGVGILDCIPQAMGALARIIGIYNPVNMVFFIGFIFSIILIFVLTITVSRLSARVRKMAQAIAILKDDHDMDEN